MTYIERESTIIKKIAHSVNQQGGNIYLVGGCVRDSIMGINNKDIDIEVHGITPETLEGILDSIGQRLEFGKSFGVYNLKGYSVDIALPRKESLIGNKHTDFKIDVDPFLGTLKAARRRDFTINALMQNVLTGEIVDHFGGIKDLENGILRHIDDDTFSEDPLRVFRAAQFSARFNFEIAEETLTLCSQMDLSTLSRERVFEELKKALLKADTPSLFFDQLKKMHQLDNWFPEISDLVGVPQNPIYHQEGDAYTHTMMVLDAAAKRRNIVKQPLYFMLSALTHDLGKITSTTTTDGITHSYNHETEGIPIAKKFLHRLTTENNLITYVLNMIKNHMKPNTVAAHNSSIKATNKMFDDSVEPSDLIHLASADGLGQLPKKNISIYETFLFERLDIYNEYMSRPFVEGSDLIIAGLEPGPEFKSLLEYAHKLRLAGVPKDSALKQTLAQRK